MINEEYLTGNSLIAYPFKGQSLALADSQDTAADAWAAGLVPLDAIIDFFIFLDEDPISLNLTYIELNAGTMTLEFSDSAGNPVLDTSIDFTSIEPYQAIPLLQNLPSPEVTAHMVAGPGLLDFPDAVSITFQPGEVILTESVWPIHPERIDRVDVDTTMDIVDADGFVTLQEGYNIDLSIQERGSINFPDNEDNEDSTSVTLQAAPGFGEGKVPPGAHIAPTYLVSLNRKVTANADGMVSLVQDNCHRFVADPADNTILVYNDCEPCCSCDDYAGPTITMKNFWDEIEPVRTSLLETIDLFNTHVLLWNDTLLPGIRKIYLTGVGIKSFIGDKNKHTLTINIINQGPSIPSGRLTVNLPENTVEVPKVVFDYDKENPRACSDLEEETTPTESTPGVTPNEVFIDFEPLCYCTTAQLMIVVQTEVFADPSEDVTVTFDSEGETLAEVTIPWK